MIYVVYDGFSVDGVGNGLAQLEIALPGLLGVVEAEIADVHSRL